MSGYTVGSTGSKSLPSVLITTVLLEPLSSWFVCTRNSEATNLPAYLPGLNMISPSFNTLHYILDISYLTVDIYQEWLSSRWASQMNNNVFCTHVHRKGRSRNSIQSPSTCCPSGTENNSGSCCLHSFRFYHKCLVVGWNVLISRHTTPTSS